MFKNYVREPVGTTPINLAVARILLAGYLIWFILTTSWNHAAAYPILTTSPEMQVYAFMYPHHVLNNIQIVAWITVVALAIFGIGLYEKYTAFISAFLMAYLGNLRHMVDTSWSTMMPLAMGVMLLFFALYHNQDELSIDGIRSSTAKGGHCVEEHLKKPLTPIHRATPLRLFLVWLGLLYFGSGLAKLVVGGIEWITAWNLGRRIEHFYQLGYFPELIDYMPFLDEMLLLGALGTIVLELGLIITIITGFLFTPFIFGLIAFHIAIALVMGPVFGRVTKSSRVQ